MTKLFAVAAFALAARQAQAGPQGSCFVWPTCSAFSLWVTIGPVPSADSPKREPGWRSPFLPSGPAPDSERNREYLEQFPLDTLKMVGTLRVGGQMYGLVQTKDGKVHRVSVGNHLGEREGKIIENNTLENQSRRASRGTRRSCHRALGAARGAGAQLTIGRAGRCLATQ